MPQTRRKRNPSKGQDSRDPERLLERSSLKSWLNTTLTRPSARPQQEHSYPQKLPGTRAQVRSPWPWCPAQMFRPASGATCVQTVGAASPTPHCWSATGACTRGSGPSPAPSVACASRGSSLWKHTSGSTAPALGGGGAGGLGSGQCLGHQSGVTGTRLCCSGTTQTSLRSVGEWLLKAGVEPDLVAKDCLDPEGDF